MILLSVADDNNSKMRCGKDLSMPERLWPFKSVCYNKENHISTEIGCEYGRTKVVLMLCPSMGLVSLFTSCMHCLYACRRRKLKDDPIVFKNPSWNSLSQAYSLAYVQLLNACVPLTCGRTILNICLFFALERVKTHQHSVRYYLMIQLSARQAALLLLSPSRKNCGKKVRVFIIFATTISLSMYYGDAHPYIHI